MLFDKIKDHTESGVYPFHMPGHKRALINPDLPYSLDMTEIEGFDNLHNPTGSIKEIEDKAAKLYKANRAFMLVNGATCGIMTAIGALTQRGDRVLIARNCHISVYRAVKLFGLKPEYILPDFIDGNEIFASINPDEIKDKLKQNPDIKLVVITSPTYEGVVSDIESISDICREYGAFLFVDEAHGAHFPFNDCFPKSAIECGADISVVSLHKTLPSLTQTALLLTNHSELESKLQSGLAVFQTSSPSYVLMCSVEMCLGFIENNSAAFEAYRSRLQGFITQANKLKKIKLLKKSGNIFDFDIGKLVILTRNTDLSGTALAEILRDKYKIETEMAANCYVICMTSVCDIDEGFNRLITALLEIDRNAKAVDTLIKPALSSLPEKSLSPYECESVQKKAISFTESAGKTSCEDIFAYPPGVPIIVSGEIISEDIIEQIISLNRIGVSVLSTYKNIPESILVIDK